MMLVFLILLFAQPSSACLVQQPLANEVKSKAHSVFIGEAISYSPRPPYDPKATSWKPAVIRFKVEKVISGPKISDVEVYWINGTFGEAATLEEFTKTYGKRTRVGITPKGSGEMDGFKDKPWILQGPCTPPYMWPEK